jgi:hypothetical protein
MAVLRDFTSSLGVWERLYDKVDANWSPGIRYLSARFNHHLI